MELNLTTIYKDIIRETPRLHIAVKIWIENNEVHYSVPEEEEYYALLIPESFKSGDHFVAPLDILVLMQIKLFFNSKFELDNLVGKYYLKERHPRKLNLNINGELFDFQKAGVRFLINNKNVILSDPPGAGKTAQAILAASYYDNILIICPSVLKDNWKNEISKWSIKNSIIVNGNKEERSKIINNYKNGFLIISYELLRLHPEITDRNWDCVLIDEAHHIKNKYAVQTVLCRRLKSTSKIPITGTPIINKIDDLFSLLTFIDPIRFKNEQRFIDYYSSELDYKKNQLEYLLSKYVLRRNQEECLKELPPIIYENIHLEMTDFQREIYNSVKKESVLHLKDKVLNITNVFSKLLRLKQLSCSPNILGFDEDGIKLKYLCEILSGNYHEKFVIFTSFATMASLIKECLGKRALVLTGNTSKETRSSLIDLYDSSENNILITTYSLGGEGLNFQSGNNVIIIDKPWTPASYEQAINRVHRRGQLNNTIVYELFIIDSIDERIDNVLYGKETLINKINIIMELASKEGLLIGN